MKLDDRTRKSSLVLTVFVVILMLIFAGPSSAVRVEVGGLGGTHYTGDSVTFYVNVSLLKSDFIPIENVTITGLRAGKLVFDPSGNEISDENGRYTVYLLKSTTYVGRGYGYGFDEATGYGYNFGNYYGSGYGYGYGYGTADGARASYRNYKIVMSTSGLSAGTDDVNVHVYTGETDKSDFTTSTSFTLKSTGSSSSGSGGGTYPPSGTPTANVTATATPTTTATTAPTSGQVTPSPSMTTPTATATGTATEGATDETTGGIPGFTAVSAVAGMLAVAYLVMRRRA